MYFIQEGIVDIIMGNGEVVVIILNETASTQRIRVKVDMLRTPKS